MSSRTGIIGGCEGARAVERELLDTLEKPLGWTGRLWIGGLVMVILAAAYAYAIQLIYGLSVTDLTDHVSWGLYMGNFVFFAGISMAGTLISAILRVTGAEWRRPITRMAEAITVFALVVGASMVIIDMGRPDRMLNLFLHGRIQSPILWDVLAINTYLAGSILYLYVAMVPDMALLANASRERGRSPLLVRIYSALSLGFRGTPEQWRRLNRALAVMAVAIIPVAVSVHTVLSWVFGMTVRPGWHSTIFGPYFVIGAIFSGTGAIITAMWIFRRAYRLEKYLTPKHFQNLGLILLALTLIYGYFSMSEYLTIWYGGTSTDTRLVRLLTGWNPIGWTFWGWAFLGVTVPALLLLVPARVSLVPMLVASILVNIGMWVKRYLIVVPTMLVPELPASGLGLTLGYSPSWVEWTVTAGGLAVFLLLFTLFFRLVPILSIWETAEDFETEGEEHASAPHPDGEPDSASHRAGRTAPAVLRSLILPAALLAGALTLAGPRPISATTPVGLPPPGIEAGAQQEGAGSPAAPSIEITVEEDGGRPWIVATVTAGGEPVPGARVAFFVERTFGPMILGTDVTFADGTAVVPFPEGLPGGPGGELAVIADIEAPVALLGATGRAVVPGGEPAGASTEPWPPRTLWSPSPPLHLLLSIGAFLLAVWSTYAFVLVQLVGIRSAKS